MSSSQEEFETLRQRQPLQTVEHVGLHNEWVVDPEFLIVLSAPGQDDKVYGLHYCEVEELKNSILFRATEMMSCSMVDPLLTQCKARLVTRDGSAWFHYDPEQFRYAVSNIK